MAGVQTSRPDGPVRRVGVAEYAVVTDGTAISTSGLGSCLGIALHDPTAGVAGLAHAMLPSNRAGRDGDPAKFVDSGVRTLFAAMERSGARVDRTTAKLAGASKMFDFSGSPPVGERNVVAARAVLGTLGVHVVGEDVGGAGGRSLRLHGDTGALVVRTAAGDVYVV